MVTDPTIFEEFEADLSQDHPVRDAAWVQERFGDVGEAPSNEVEVDPDAPPALNVERPCEGEVADD